MEREAPHHRSAAVRGGVRFRGQPIPPICAAVSLSTILETYVATSRKRSVKTRAGDIFAMPAPNRQSGYGQIIVGGSVFYVAVFREIYDSPPDLDELLLSEILLAGWTLDALIYHGEWQVIGNRPPISDRVPFPTYKVRINGLPYIHEFTGKKRRPATPEYWELLDYKTTVAPIQYQNALLAHHGLGEWRDHYDEITIEHVRRRVLVGDGEPKSSSRD